MIDPERWYEYQRNYQKYGFDMKPKPDQNQLRQNEPGREKLSRCRFR